MIVDGFDSVLEVPYCVAKAHVILVFNDGFLGKQNSSLCPFLNVILRLLNLVFGNPWSWIVHLLTKVVRQLVPLIWCKNILTQCLWLMLHTRRSHIEPNLRIAGEKASRLLKALECLMIRVHMIERETKVEQEFWAMLWRMVSNKFQRLLSFFVPVLPPWAS